MMPLGSGVSKAGIPNAPQGHHWSDAEHHFWCCQGSGVEAFARKEQLGVVQLPKRRWHDLWLVTRRARPLSARLAHARKLAIEAAGQLR